jgi:hypothetical protein
VLFLLTQDLSLPRGMVDAWTTLHLILFVTQSAILAFAILSKRAVRTTDTEATF